MKDIGEIDTWWDTDLDDEILDFGLWKDETVRNLRRKWINFAFERDMSHWVAEGRILVTTVRENSS